MIRTAGDESVSRFLGAAFLDLMSHFCDTESFAPCDEAKCEITEAEWKAIPFEVLDLAIGEDMQAFDEVGSEFFVRKKIAQLIKIAKSEKEIQLDLVSELILYLIGMGAACLSWKGDDGMPLWGDDAIYYPDRDKLIAAFTGALEDDEEADPEFLDMIKGKFDSLYSLISGEDVFDIVFFDDDFTFLLEDDVADGIRPLYLACPEYDRAWLERPWTDIGEEVPYVVKYELDALEEEAAGFGGLEAMREAYMAEYAKTLNKMKR